MVTDEQGRWHSLDVQASSTYDAAHLYAHAKMNPAVQFPIPTLATVFEVVTSGRLYYVKGAALQRWIAQRRQEWKGPKGFLFSQRPTLWQKACWGAITGTLLSAGPRLMMEQ